jgi:hypothetical protein
MTLVLNCPLDRGGVLKRGQINSAKLQLQQRLVSRHLHQKSEISRIGSLSSHVKCERTDKNGGASSAHQPDLASATPKQECELFRIATNSTGA